MPPYRSAVSPIIAGRESEESEGVSGIGRGGGFHGALTIQQSIIRFMVNDLLRLAS